MKFDFEHLNKEIIIIIKVGLLGFCSVLGYEYTEVYLDQYFISILIYLVCYIVLNVIKLILNYILIH